MGMMVNPYRYSAAGGSFSALDPDDTYGVGSTFSNNDRTVQRGAQSDIGWVLGKHGVSSGKYFFEVTLNSDPGDDIGMGIVEALFIARTTAIAATTGSRGYDTGGNASAASDVFRFIVDADAGKLWIRRNGTLISGDPQAGTGGTDISGMRKALYPAVQFPTAGGQVTFNFGNAAWASAAEVGFDPWPTDEPVTYAAWRTFGILAKVGGNFVFAAAEVEVMASSGGSNILSGATGSGSHALDSGSFANMIDGDTTTYGAITTNGYATAAQPPGWFRFAFASSAARNATHFAERGRSGAGSSQAWTVMDVYLSTDDTVFWKAGANYLLGSFSSTTPGTRNEITL